MSSHEARYDEGYNDGYSEGRRVTLKAAFCALDRMVRHSASEVRIAALEAAAEISTVRAKELASMVVNDRSRSVREAAQAILAKEG